MNRNRTLLALLVTAAIVAAGVAGGLILTSSHSAKAGPSAASGNRLSPLEAAQIRDQRQGKFSEPAADAVMTAHATQTINGKTWKIVSYKGKSGTLCAGTTLPGEGQAMTCRSPADWFAHGPVYVEPGAQQDPGHAANWSRFVLSGMVDVHRVQSLKLVNTDCSTSNVAVDSGGFFLDVVESAAIDRNVWPYKLVATAANGRIVASVHVESDAPDTDAVRDAGTTAPTPSSACA